MQLTAHEIIAIEDGAGRKLCSGVAVGDQRVLTAAHCLPGAQAIRRTDGSAVEFRVEERAKDTDAVALTASVRSSPLACDGAGLALLRSGRPPCPVADAMHVGCTLEPGDSGSPLVDCDAGRARVVGVLSGLRQRGTEQWATVAAVRALEPSGRPGAFGIAGIAAVLAVSLLVRRASRKSYPG